jgi:hypothetical protein
VAVVLVAYLAGKDSGRRAAEEVRSAPVPTVAVEGESPAPPEPALEDFSGQGRAPSEATEDDYEPPFPTFEEVVQEAEPTAWGDTAAPAATTPSGQAEVAAYFAQIEAYERQAKYWSNPQEFAMALIGQGAKGDTRGFEQLIQTHRQAQEQIESMTVPLPCQEHHRRTLALLRQALRLLEALQRGVASGSVGGLAALSGDARQLETQAREVDVLAADLKHRFGL